MWSRGNDDGKQWHVGKGRRKKTTGEGFVQGGLRVGEAVVFIHLNSRTLCQWGKKGACQSEAQPRQLTSKHGQALWISKTWATRALVVNNHGILDSCSQTDKTWPHGGGTEPEIDCGLCVSTVAKTLWRFFKQQRPETAWGRHT